MIDRTGLYCPKTDDEYSKHECEVELLLSSLGLRRSKDRHSLVSLFHEARTWSIAELLVASHHTDNSTVYRNLRILEKNGLVTKIQTNEFEARYEWALGKHHDHNTCSKCGAVECISCPIPKIKDHSLQLLNICSACK